MDKARGEQFVHYREVVHSSECPSSEAPLCLCLSLSCFTSSYPPFFDEHPFRIYEKILEGKIEWPKSGILDANAKDLIKKLLSRDVTSRLGSLKVGIITVELLNKGHFGGNNFVPCREVVPFSEVK